ncbi:MAG: MerR family transcriptional regulator, partial [Acidimicrobiales bacterium]
MSLLVAIGDFSNMTHLSVKALRHYHDVGLLEPAEVDRSSGYRYYLPEQVPTAQVIRRFRDLGMPVEEVKTMLSAPDIGTRNKMIVAHLERMESQLQETRATVASLRAVLDGPAPAGPVEYRTVAAAPAFAVRSVVDVGGVFEWFSESFAELRRALEESGAQRSGPDGALYPGEFFELERAEIVAFVPVHGPVEQPATSAGGAELVEIPAADLAVMLHAGSFDEID